MASGVARRTAGSPTDDLGHLIKPQLAQETAETHSQQRSLYTDIASARRRHPSRKHSKSAAEHIVSRHACAVRARARALTRDRHLLPHKAQPLPLRTCVVVEVSHAAVPHLLGQRRAHRDKMRAGEGRLLAAHDEGDVRLASLPKVRAAHAHLVVYVRGLAVVEVIPPVLVRARSRQQEAARLAYGVVERGAVEGRRLSLRLVEARL
eukprot:scaffold93333_cov67-Phaeocystis_antarctica.AAC.2